jgi:hypothetical protein
MSRKTSDMMKGLEKPDMMKGLSFVIFATSLNRPSNEKAIYSTHLLLIHTHTHTKKGSTFCLTHFYGLPIINPYKI